jgi:hypothetical protein
MKAKEDKDKTTGEQTWGEFFTEALADEAEEADPGDEDQPAVTYTSSNKSRPKR